MIVVCIYIVWINRGYFTSQSVSLAEAIKQHNDDFMPNWSVSLGGLGIFATVKSGKS